MSFLSFVGWRLTSSYIGRPVLHYSSVDMGKLGILGLFLSNCSWPMYFMYKHPPKVLNINKALFLRMV